MDAEDLLVDDAAEGQQREGLVHALPHAVALGLAEHPLAAGLEGALAVLQLVPVDRPHLVIAAQQEDGVRGQDLHRQQISGHLHRNATGAEHQTAWATTGQVCFTAISPNHACPTVFIALSSVFQIIVLCALLSECSMAGVWLGAWGRGGQGLA